MSFESKPFFLRIFAPLFLAVRTQLVTYNLNIYSPFMASSPQLSG